MRSRGGSEGTGRSLLSPSPPLPLFLLIVFLVLFLRAAPHYPNAWNRLQFSSGRFSSTSTSGNASFWLVLILSDQSQLTRAEDLLYRSTVQKTGRRLSAWSKRNQGASKKTSESELTANFHSIFYNYFFPSHSPSLGRSQGCLPFAKSLRKIRQKCEWGTAFRVVPVKNLQEQQTIWKDSPVVSDGMFQTEISVWFVEPFLKHHFQAFARGTDLCKW